MTLVKQSPFPCCLCVFALLMESIRLIKLLTVPVAAQSAQLSPVLVVVESDRQMVTGKTEKNKTRLLGYGLLSLHPLTHSLLFP